MSDPSIDRFSDSAESSARFANQRQRSTRLILLAARLMFMALVLATPALVVGSVKTEFPATLVVGLTLASGALGLIVVVIDSMSPNKQLASIFGIYLGICLGLIGAYAIGTLLDTIVVAWSLKSDHAVIYLNLTKVSIGLILCYIAVSVVMTTKDDFRLVIPYVEFSKQNRGVRPMLLDTSAVIDGRILDLAQSGAIDAPFVVLQAVIDELQRLADSGDKGKRARGRRGLDMIARLQGAPRIDLSIEDLGFEGANVDRGLVEVAKRNAYRLITTDTALAKVAEIAGVPAVNINTLAGSLRAQMLPGDRIEVELTKAGESPSQGVGYLPRWHDGRRGGGRTAHRRHRARGGDEHPHHERGAHGLRAPRSGRPAAVGLGREHGLAGDQPAEVPRRRTAARRRWLRSARLGPQPAPRLTHSKKNAACVEHRRTPRRKNWLRRLTGRARGAA